MSGIVRSSLETQWYLAAKAGNKTVEGRLSAHRLTTLPPGAKVEFLDAARAAAPPLGAVVTKTAHYPSFRAMLEAEGLPAVLPGVESIEAGVEVYRKYYSESKERSKGVTAVHFAVARD